MNMFFAQMFPDSEIARKFACGRTKTTAIVKEALSPYSLTSIITLNTAAKKSTVW